MTRSYPHSFRVEMKRALKEDCAWNDVTNRFFLPLKAKAGAKIIAKESGVVAGVYAAREVFLIRDPRSRVTVKIRDGKPVRKGEVILVASGYLSSLLSAERTALNILSHMSGIASFTAQFVKRVGKKGPKILDTRKTTPGLRDLQKWAVVCGGGENHRRDLSDGVFIKENHLSVIKTEKQLADYFTAVRKIQSRRLKVVMEAQNKRQILWGLFSGVDILLLDNFSVKTLPNIVRWIKRFCHEKSIILPLLEISGGVNLKNIKAYAKTGVDRISIGALTHSAPALNMNMDIRL